MRLTLALLATLFALTSLPTVAQGPTESVEAQLCRNQLDLLLAREKLTSAEEAVFKAQCDCLDVKAKSGDQRGEQCAHPHE